MEGRGREGRDERRKESEEEGEEGEDEEEERDHKFYLNISAYKRQSRSFYGLKTLFL